MRSAGTEITAPADRGSGRRATARPGQAKREPSARRRLSERRLIVCTGLAAALPVIVAGLYAVLDDWVPLGDDAFTATRSFDVFTERSPQVGQYSSGASGVVGEPAYSPGPLLFWLLAVPVRLPWQSAPAVVMAAVNAACVVGLVALARRRGGWPLMVAVGLAVPIMLASLPAETYSDVWNPSAPLLPLALLVFLAWSVACGEWRLLPVTALVSSYVVQAHLPVVAPAVAVTAVGLAGALLVGGRARDRDAGARGAAKAGARAKLGWGAAALVVALLCWSAPLIEELTNDPGNLSLLERSATTDEPTLGSAAGWRALVHTVGVPPWWLRETQDPLGRIGDLSSSPGPVGAASTVLVLVALGVTTLIGRRRRRADLPVAGVLGLVLCAAVALDASATPESAFATVNYVFRWTSPAGMCVWLLLGWSIAVILAPARRPLPRWRPVSGALAALGATVVVGGVVAATENPPRDEPYRAMRAIDERLVAELPAEPTTRVDAAYGPDSFGLAIELQAGAVHCLRREGRKVFALGHEGGFGRAYARGRAEQVVQIGVDAPPVDSGREIARLAVSDPVLQDAAPPRTVTATILPAAAAPVEP
jgi:hypothetical protein